MAGQRARSLLRRLRGSEPSLYTTPSFEHSREIEARQNAESTPPDDERLEWHLTYLGEVFLPSHAASLLRGIEALGWRDDGDQRRVYDWVRRSREQGWFQGYCPVGCLVRERRGPGAQEMELPEGIEHAHPVFWAISPGVTALTVQFVLDEDHGRLLDAVLRTTYGTITTPIQNGWRVHGPHEQKRADLIATAAGIRAHCEAWLAERLPGAFAAGLCDGRFPAVDLVTMRGFVPFGPESRAEGLFSYREVADLDSGFETYSSPSVPNLMLSFPWRPDRPEHVLTLGGQESQLLSEEQLGGYYGGTDRAALASWLHLRVDDLAVTWTLHHALTAFHAALAARRDLALRLDDEPRELVDNLRHLRNSLLPQAWEAEVLAADVTALAEDEHALPVRGLDWTRAIAPDRHDLPLGAAMRERCGYLARLLGQTEARLRETVATDAQLGTAAANLRLQRRVARLTWVSVGIALVALAGVVAQVVEVVAK